MVSKSNFNQTSLFDNTLIARFMGSAWDPSGADRTQVGPMLAPWTLLSGYSPYSKHPAGWWSGSWCSMLPARYWPKKSQIIDFRVYNNNHCLKYAANYSQALVHVAFWNHLEVNRGVLLFCSTTHACVIFSFFAALKMMQLNIARGESVLQNDIGMFKEGNFNRTSNSYSQWRLCLIIICRWQKFGFGTVRRAWMDDFITVQYNVL